MPAISAAQRFESLRQLIVIFLLLTLGILTIGTGYFQYRSRVIKKEKQDELSAIANLKVNQIVQWRHERMIDGFSIFHNPILVEQIHSWMKSPFSSAARKDISQWLDLQQKFMPYERIYITDSLGKILLASAGDSTPASPLMKALIGHAAHSRMVELSDFHCRAGNGAVHLDLIVPIIDSCNGSSRVLGAVVLSINPQDFLFPLIQTWPAPSKTSETILVHREGNDVVYLNELRHKKNTTLTLRFPVDSPRLPAAMAVNGQEGVIEGTDYRNVPVLSSLRHIPDSPWYMVAKVDKAEIYGPLRAAFLIDGILTFLLIGFAGVSVGLFNRHQSSRRYRSLYESEKKAREALRESEERFRKIFEEGRFGMVIVNEKFTFVRANAAFCAMIGYSEQELASKTFKDITHPEHLAGDVENVAKLFRGEIPVYKTEKRYVRRDGGLVWGAAVITVIRDNEGKFLHFLTMIEDITERKAAAEALAAERERLSVTLRSIGDGVISTDTDGRVAIMNRVAEELTGWKQDEAMGKPLAEIFHIINEHTRQPCENPVEKVLITGSIVTLANHTVLINRNGKEMLIIDSGAPIKNKASETVGVVLVFRDNTEKQKAAENMIKAEKLESIGVLAGGIAHDFNNLLVGIFGYIEIAREFAVDNEKVEGALSKAAAVFNRTRDLTRQLLTFSKGGSPVKKPLLLGDVLRENTRFALSGSTVHPTFSIPDDLWVCDADENQIGQVIDNLVINAQQAMPQGGQIAVKAENVVLSPGNSLPLDPGNYIKISIKDQGIGIAREHLSKIFDPFFTTKQKGSGLGLATSFSIVTKHGGFIDVESEMGKGSTFFMYLPVSKTIYPDSKKTMPPHAGSGRILVMDNEDFVLEVTKSMLSRVGFDVETARSGEEAVTLFKQYLAEKKSFAAVILDLTIPGGMGGKEALRALLALDPDIKAIACSGYSEDPVMANPGEFGFVDKIKKPFLKEELTEVLSRVMSHA